MEYIKCGVSTCPARSLVQAAKILLSPEKEEEELMYIEMCGHHFNLNHASLLLQGFEVLQDERDKGQVYDTAKFIPQS